MHIREIDDAWFDIIDRKYVVQLGCENFKKRKYIRKEKNQRTNTSNQITPTSNLCSLKETVHSFTQTASSQKKEKRKCLSRYIELQDGTS